MAVLRLSVNPIETLKEDKGRVSCRDGKRKRKCPRVAEGLGCTESCKCYNCGNIFQIGGVSASPGTGRKRRRATISTYKRQQGKEFMERQKAPVTSGPLRLLEALCLVVCKDIKTLILQTKISLFCFVFNELLMNV